MADKLVIGNWKMHGRLATLGELVKAILNEPCIRRHGVGLAPPVPYLDRVNSWLEGSGCALVAQDVSQFANDGAYTGEYSASMLVDCGCRYVLIGHSERRRYLGERDTVLLNKLQHSMSAGLTPILCVGETLAERDSGQCREVIQRQLAIISRLPVGRLIVAYEPVWAIGTGRVASLEQVAVLHADIKLWCLQLLGNNANIPVLYGGSVNADNASKMLSVDSVDGVLVGGASLDAKLFAIICQAARKLV